jgi:methionyl-tRNA synthetase
MLEKFGVDATRYLLLSAGPFGHDIDVTIERMTEKYNSDLANGLGNLVSRVLKLADSNNFDYQFISMRSSSESALEYLKELNFDDLLEFIQHRIRNANEEIEKSAPWKLAKDNREEFENVMDRLMDTLSSISELIEPIMPETSEKIKKALETKQVEPLFQRIK